MGCPGEMGRRCLHWSLVGDCRGEEPLGPVSLGDGSQLLEEKAACCTRWVRGDGLPCRPFCSSVRRMGHYGRRGCGLLCSSGEKARWDIDVLIPLVQPLSIFFPALALEFGGPSSEPRGCICVGFKPWV
ncbi:hypothetical protein CRG98_044399 [Punica granatum]|uniref:Uncharacterized protein n=1 Tax=Punica granatum TaxID=22663 RepID=A0A2I0HUE1_PUNGR|nr:hypothetical protein CRG98_044399 [Punica granatum]